MLDCHSSRKNMTYQNLPEKRRQLPPTSKVMIVMFVSSIPKNKKKNKLTSVRITCFYLLRIIFGVMNKTKIINFKEN